MDDLHYALDWIRHRLMGEAWEFDGEDYVFAPDVKPSTATGRQWLVNAIKHLDRRINAYLRVGEERYSPDRAALAIVQGVAQELGTAADALDHCAHYLKEKTGSPYEASKAHVAATRAREAQQSLVVERTQTDWPIDQRRAG